MMAVDSSAQPIQLKVNMRCRRELKLTIASGPLQCIGSRNARTQTHLIYEKRGNEPLDEEKEFTKIHEKMHRHPVGLNVCTRCNSVEVLKKSLPLIPRMLLHSDTYPEDSLLFRGAS